MPPDFPPPETFLDLVRIAVREDLGDDGDVTSALTVPDDLVGVGTLYQKSPGVVAGLPIVRHVCREVDERLTVEVVDGAEGRHAPGKLERLAVVRGPMRSVLSAERTLLNFVQRMGGIATLTRRYVDAVAGTSATILDTRKTLPGHRALDKYAVRAGGGRNHRVGLYDMVLVKDNHLAQLGQGDWATRLAEMVRRSKAARPTLPIEVEVVSPEQFGQVLAIGGVDVVLLDNMDRATMAACVARRDAAGLRDRLQLEASGGITLDTVAAVAATGVDRISVGALTHSVTALDVSLEVEVAS